MHTESRKDSPPTLLDRAVGEVLATYNERYTLLTMGAEDWDHYWGLVAQSYSHQPDVLRNIHRFATTLKLGMAAEMDMDEETHDTYLFVLSKHFHLQTAELLFYMSAGTAASDVYPSSMFTKDDFNFEASYVTERLIYDLEVEAHQVRQSDVIQHILEGKLEIGETEETLSSKLSESVIHATFDVNAYLEREDLDPHYWPLFHTLVGARGVYAFNTEGDAIFRTFVYDELEQESVIGDDRENFLRALDFLIASWIVMHRN